MVKYAKGLEKIISDNHQTMQLYYSLQEAEYNEDYKLANEILKEIREHDAHQWHRIRHLEGKNK